MEKHFLALNQFTKQELDGIFDLTRELKAKQKKGIEHHLLKGKTLAMIFEKSSTRTRVSFEAGIFQLGGHGLFISTKDSQMGRGEPIKDTARCMARYCDGVMIRTYGQEIVEEFATILLGAGDQWPDRSLSPLPDHGGSVHSDRAPGGVPGAKVRLGGGRQQYGQYLGRGCRHFRVST